MNPVSFSIDVESYRRPTLHRLARFAKIMTPRYMSKVRDILVNNAPHDESWVLPAMARRIRDALRGHVTFTQWFIHTSWLCPVYLVGTGADVVLDVASIGNPVSLTREVRVDAATAKSANLVRQT